MPDDRDGWLIAHFGLSNPTGEGQGDVPRLLRSLADSIELLGDVQIQDITFHSEVTDAEDSVGFTVYYVREPRRR